MFPPFYTNFLSLSGLALAHFLTAINLLILSTVFISDWKIITTLPCVSNAYANKKSPALCVFKQMTFIYFGFG